MRGTDLKRYVGLAVVVNLDAEAFAGTLDRTTAGTVELAHVTRVSETGHETEVGGRVVVPAAAVRTVQVRSE